MTLIDTSVWVDHIREPIADLNRLLDLGLVVQHPMVTVEVALGTFKTRERVIAAMLQLPIAPPVTTEQLLRFIDSNALAGCGVGLVDTNLLAASAMSGLKLWTRDRRLQAQAERLGLSFEPD